MPSAASSSNAPFAVDDAFSGFENGALLLDVLANDRGGNGKSLVSASPTSALGATIGLSGGKIAYSATSPLIEKLAAGETAQDTFTYTIQVGNGALSVAKVVVTLTGTNDAPVVSGVATGVATEDGSSLTLNGLVNATDVDNGAVLSVVDVPANLPAGVTFADNSFTLDPTNAAYQSLAAGQTTTVTVNYGVSDGVATTAGSAQWTVTGANDAPLVSGNVAGAATEGGDPVSLNALANASDPDNGAVLGVTGVNALPAGVSYDAATHSFTLDPTDPAYIGLNAGQSQVVSVSYDVTDGSATTPGSVSWTVEGVNNAPTTSDHLIDFEDLMGQTSYSVGYAGFKWGGQNPTVFWSFGGNTGPSPIAPIDWDNNGGDKEAFNAFLPTTMTMTRLDGSDFDLVSLDMANGISASGFNQANQVDLVGWDDGVVVYRQHVSLSDTVMANYLLNFMSIDAFDIVVTGGLAGGRGLYSFDNILTHY